MRTGAEDEARSRFITSCGRRQGLWHRLQRGLDRLRGNALRCDLSVFLPRLAELGEEEAVLSVAPDDQLRERSEILRMRALQGENLAGLEAEGFALVREACRRTVGLTPFRSQLLAALALRDGHVVELPTGEGKTLAAVFPTYLHALAGKGAHVLTFNDYLARRDAAWMGPIYELLGLHVDSVQEGMESRRRRRAYAADVTYLTAREAGFDLLRDSLEVEPGGILQRGHHFALVDEADSLMIDEARIPLVIAGGSSGEGEQAYRMAELVRNLEPQVHFDFGEHGRSVDLTEQGLDHVEGLLGCGDLLAAENLGILTAVNCALHALHLLRRDVDYVLKDGGTRMVDEFTGRIVEDRQWPAGLQTALDAKEGVASRPEGRVLGSWTLQHLFRSYRHLCGMTGTARSVAEELGEVYGCAVVVVPPNRACIREDLPDRLFTHRAARDQAVIRQVQSFHARGRPVLVGTRSVEESEALAAQLQHAGTHCQVLNARDDEREALVLSRAGGRGAVTISTNMAGRGADIRLGGADGADRDEIVALGGLHVIGTRRHEALRIDRQLRGRAGRQGDPGSSEFFVSLEDDLFVRHDIRSRLPEGLWPDSRDGTAEGMAVRREVARAQRIADAQNREIRRTLTRYAEPVERQRRILADRRSMVLHGRTESRLESLRPHRWQSLVRTVGERVLREGERRVALFQIDRAWSEHLESLADLREGIHLRRVGGQDPLQAFAEESAHRFQAMMSTLDDRVLSALEQASWNPDGIDLERRGMNPPTSTWTYVVSEGPFRDQLGVQLTGNVGAAAATALYAGPLLILWGLCNRYLRRRSR